ncbi:MAG: asparagine synthase (glutamine-hydrolyzing) [Deltaproteobacteria bacterium]|nr:asparagine synthase (glutamine-hydrolyzing) [Deltaproteobacteria bacterium]
MCGIAGHLDFDTAPRPGILDPVLERLRHRGPDRQSLWFGPNMVLGHTRLAILDLSPAGNQPMVDPDTGTAIVFNGEMYNFAELREELRDTGYPFRSSGDTEVILALYRKFGTEAVCHMRGMFALGIWDPVRERLILARDRLGQKPLFYALRGRRIVFASEIRALAAHSEIDRSVDPVAVDLFFSLECIPAPLSIHTAIRKLPPAHVAVFDRNGWTMERYWALDYRPKIDLSEREALDGLTKALDRAVALRMRSDVPFGALLSGGIDSSLIAESMVRLMDRPPKTFSIGFTDRRFDESPHARRVATILGTEHHEEIMPPTSLELLPPLARQFGEPFADDAALATFFLCRMARQEVTVALGGDGGDELMCGYPTFVKTRLARLADGILSSRPGRLDTLDSLARSSGPSARVRRHIISHWLRPELKPLLRNEARLAPVKDRLFTADFRTATRKSFASWYLPWYAGSFSSAANPVERLLWLDNQTSLPDQLLVKTDIASMAHSLEVRCPFLDHPLIEYCASLPLRFKIQGRTTKYLLKRLAEQFLPTDLVHRPKQGFSMPVGQWLRGPMAGFLQDALGSSRDVLRAYINMDALETMAGEHSKGQQDHTTILWRTLNFALWARENRNP